VDPSATGKVLVLPPALINAAAQQEWIAPAIQQSLATDLTRHLPQSVEAGDRAARSINDAIDQARGVDATQLVTGTVQFNGDQLRFTGQVVDVKTAKPIEAIIVTGQTKDLFVLEDSITEQATKALLPKKANPTTAPAAPAAIAPSGPLRIDYAAATLPAGMEYAVPYQDNRFQAESDRHFFGTPSYYYGGWGWGWGWGYAPFGWWYSSYPTPSPGWAW
jgi:TolB-like protein